MPECFHKSETHLQLCLQQVGVFSFVGIAIGVLRLQAAFGIEPPLHTGHIVALFVILRFVFVEIIIGCYNVEFGKYMYGCGCIVSVAFTCPSLPARYSVRRLTGFVCMVAPADQRLRV